MIKKIKISEPKLITDEEEIRYLNEIMPLKCEISELKQRIFKLEKENQQLKEQLHNASIQMQEIIGGNNE